MYREKGELSHRLTYYGTWPGNYERILYHNGHIDEKWKYKDWNRDWEWFFYDYNKKFLRKEVYENWRKIWY